MKSFLMLVLSLSAPLAILAGPPSKDKDKDLSTNPGRPFQSLELRLDRNYQATLDVPGLVVDNLKDLFPAPRVGALRWISPDWKVGLNSFATGLQRIVTRIFVFNPDPVFPVKVIVKTFLPDGTPVAFPDTEKVIPPFGQASVLLRQETNQRGSAVIEADGPVLPDGVITTFIQFDPDLGRDTRTMTWYPDHTFNQSNPDNPPFPQDGQ